MSDQLQMDWDYFQRRGWISDAAISDGATNTGKLVKADKLTAVLHQINDHLGDNPEAWPSQEKMAKALKVSTQTISRAAQALQNMSLLIVQLKCRPGQKQPVNHYRVVWSELLLLDPDRRRAFGESIAGRARPAPNSPGHQRHPERSDLGTERSDLGMEQSDLGTERSDLGSQELLTNKPKNKPKNSPPQAKPSSGKRCRRNQPRAQSIPEGWEVVVSVLNSLEVRACDAAVTAAIARELTPSDVLELAERWSEFQKRNSAATPAWLYRWITGQSSPPLRQQENTPEQGSSPRGHFLSSAEREQQSLRRLRTRIFQAGKKCKKSEAEISRDLVLALIEHGFEPDAILV